MATKEIPTLKEFLQEQAADRDCKLAAQTVRLPTSLFADDRNRVLVREAPEDRALQKFVPAT